MSPMNRVVNGQVVSQGWGKGIAEGFVFPGKIFDEKMLCWSKNIREKKKSLKKFKRVSFWLFAINSFYFLL